MGVSLQPSEVEIGCLQDIGSCLWGMASCAELAARSTLDVLRRGELTVGQARSLFRQGAARHALFHAVFCEDATKNRRKSLFFRWRHGKMRAGVGGLGKNGE